MAIDMYLPAFKEIAAALNTTPAKVSLSLSSYFIGLAAGQLVYGPLLDRFGRKKPLYFGMILFMLASLFCMQARTVESLVCTGYPDLVMRCEVPAGTSDHIRKFLASAGVTLSGKVPLGELGQLLPALAP